MRKKNTQPNQHGGRRRERYQHSRADLDGVGRGSLEIGAVGYPIWQREIEQVRRMAKRTRAALANLIARRICGAPSFSIDPQP